MVATDVHEFFCDPQSPWRRGANENTNLLLRQYFPRGTDPMLMFVKWALHRSGALYLLSSADGSTAQSAIGS